MAPIATGIGDITVPEDSAATRISLYAAFEDAEDDSDDLTYEVVGVSPGSLLTATVDSSTGELVLNCLPDANGAAQVTIRATDSAEMATETMFTVNVTPVNDAPTTSGIADIGAVQDQQPTVANLWIAFSDVEDSVSQMTYSVVSNSGASLVQPVIHADTGELVLQYLPGATGIATIVVRATDSEGLSVDAATVVRVWPSTALPVLYWDPDGNPLNNVISTGDGLGGSGQWTSGAGSLWYDPVTGQDVPWVNGSRAVLAGTAGTVSISGQISADELTFNSGGYTIQSGTLLLPSALGTTIETASGTSTIKSAVTGSGELHKLGTGTLVLNSTGVTYTGPTTLSGGTLRFQDTTAMANGTSAASFNIAAGTTLELNVTSGKTWNLGLTVCTVISGSGTLKKTGPGTLALGNQGGHGEAVDFRLTGGTIDLQGGTVVNAASGGIWTSNKAKLNIAAGVTLDLHDGNPVCVDALTGGGTVTCMVVGDNQNLTIGVADGTGTFSGTIAEAVGHTISVTKIGSGTQTLTGSNAYSGLTTVNDGVLRIGNGGNTGSLPGSTAVIIGSSGTVRFYRNDSPAIANTFSGSGTLKITGPGGSDSAVVGSYILSGDNSAFTGSLIIDKARLSDLNGGPTTSFGSGTITVLAGGQLWASNGAVTYPNNITISGSGWLESGGCKAGALRLTENTTWAGNVTLGSKGRVTAYGGSAGTITGTIGGNFQLELGGSGGSTDGMLTLAPSARNTYKTTKLSGNVIVLAGNANALSAGGLNTNGGTLNTNGFDFSFAKLLGSGGQVQNGSTTISTITVGSSNTDTKCSGTLADGGSAALALVKVGTGRLTLDGDNTYTGGTTIEDGTLRVGSGETTGTLGGGNVVDNSLLVFNRSDDVAFDKAISGSGGLTQTGKGTLILSGASTYAGETVICGGTLMLGTDDALPTTQAVRLGDQDSGSGVLDLNGHNQSLAGLYTDTESDQHRPFLDTVTNSSATAAKLTVNISSDSLYAGVFAGNLALDKYGPGKWTVSGVNTNWGDVAVYDGTLQIDGCFSADVHAIPGFGNPQVCGQGDPVYWTLLGVGVEGEGRFTNYGGPGLAVTSNSVNITGDWRTAVYAAVSGSVYVNETGHTLVFPTTGLPNGNPLAFKVGTVAQLKFDIDGNQTPGSGKFDLYENASFSELYGHPEKKLIVMEDLTGLTRNDYDYDDVYWVLDAFSADLHADSNNNGTIDNSYTGTDDPIEDVSGQPGKIVAVGGPRVPMVVSLSDWNRPERTLKFQNSSNGLRLYSAAEGGNERSFNTNYTLAQLGMGSQGGTLWVEATQASQTAGDQRVELLVNPVDVSGSAEVVDAVRFTNDARPTATLAAAGGNEYNEHSTLNFTASATDVDSADQAAGFTFDWSVTKDGQAYRNGSSGANSQNYAFNFVPDDNGAYVVTVTAMEKDGGVSNAVSGTYTVSNVVPSNLQMTTDVSPEEGGEGETLSLSGTFEDPGEEDPHQVLIDWGDGLANTTVPLGENVLEFSNIQHPYAEAGMHTVHVTVADANFSDAGASTTLAVDINSEVRVQISSFISRTTMTIHSTTRWRKAIPPS